MKKLVVFDLDGTLHYTEKALTPAIAAATVDITKNTKPSSKLINSLFGEPLEKICKVLTGKNDPTTYERFREQLQFHQALTLPESGELYPGVVKMLDQMSDLDFDLAVLSNAHIEYIVLVTEVLGIKEKFVELRGRDISTEASKTTRLQEMCEKYDFAVMVGDRYHDIQAALENSLPVLACAYGYGSSHEHIGAIIVNSVEVIVPEIKKLLIR